MDHFKILSILITNENDWEDLDSKFEKNLEKVYPLLDEDLRSFINEHKSTDEMYLQTILGVLKSLQDDVLTESSTFMSIEKCRVVKTAIKFAIVLGILVNLMPGIGTGLKRLGIPNLDQLKRKNLTDIQKYGRLKTTIRTLVACYDEISLRPVILAHLGPIFEGLFQLAHAPLAKPKPGSEITEEIYQQLLSDQEEFQEKLELLLRKCPEQFVLREIMILSGLQNAPKWLKWKTQEYFTEIISRPTGIMSVVSTICEDTSDIVRHSKQLTTISMLIANSFKEHTEEFNNSICKQVLAILKSNKTKNEKEIANIFINSLLQKHPDVCREKIIGEILSTLMLPQAKDEIVTRSETEVFDCIELLSKCFLPDKDASFKYIPIREMKTVAVPLFCIHKKIHQSVSLLRSKVRELLSHLLSDNNINDKLFSIFLEHSESSGEFGERVAVEFGSSGGVKVSNKPEDDEQPNEKYFEDIVNCFYQLVEMDKLSVNLLNYLLQWLINFNHQQLSTNYLETSEGRYTTALKQLTAINLLEKLVNKPSVQSELINSPEVLFKCIKNIFTTGNSDNIENQEVLYTSLMLIKIIITEGNKPNSWRHFDSFSDFLQKKLKDSTFPTALLNLVNEIIEMIRKRGKVGSRFEDLNVESKKRNCLNEALHDLTDPLLPVRAHGLITLTRLIETSDAEALAKKDIILYLFKENLKDEDSFIYLAVINGLCAMALKFPEDVISTLIEEFIDMPQKHKIGEIPPENRIKVGEILVKTTRLLGDMAPKYKNPLINGFLCAIRDPDSMVRASSLSCLGELCKVLGFKIGNAITEIIHCISCIIETDKSDECRRAAVLVITLLIRGLGKSVLLDLAADLLPVYRYLKLLHNDDKDDVLRLHAQLALEELDDIVKDALFAKPVLEKRIFVIDS